MTLRLETPYMSKTSIIMSICIVTKSFSLCVNRILEIFNLLLPGR